MTRRQYISLIAAYRDACRNYDRVCIAHGGIGSRKTHEAYLDVLNRRDAAKRALDEATAELQGHSMAQIGE